MPYVDGLLASGEQVLRREKQHWILPFYIAGRWVAIAFAVFVLSLVVNVWIIPGGNGGLFGTIAGFISTLLTWVTVGALIVAVAGFAWSAAIWRTQEYVLTNQRVVHVRGVVNKTSSDSVLESLTDAQIEIPFLGRAMGWGNLVLMTANESGNMKMLALRDPIEFKKAVFQAKTDRQVGLNTGFRAAAQPSSPVAAAAAPPIPAPVAAQPAATGEEVTRTLTALAGLRDSGAITAEEYEAKKKQLLDRI